MEALLENLATRSMDRITTDSTHETFYRDDAIHTARAESLKVERDEFESQGAKGLNQLTSELKLDQAWQIIEGDFDTRVNLPYGTGLGECATPAGAAIAQLDRSSEHAQEWDLHHRQPG